MTISEIKSYAFQLSQDLKSKDLAKVKGFVHQLSKEERDYLVEVIKATPEQFQNIENQYPGVSSKIKSRWTSLQMPKNEAIIKRISRKIQNVLRVRYSTQDVLNIIKDYDKPLALSNHLKNKVDEIHVNIKPGEYNGLDKFQKRLYIKDSSDLGEKVSKFYEKLGLQTDATMEEAQMAYLQRYRASQSQNFSHLDEAYSVIYCLHASGPFFEPTALLDVKSAQEKFTQLYNKTSGDAQAELVMQYAYLLKAYETVLIS